MNEFLKKVDENINEVGYLNSRKIVALFYAEFGEIEGHFDEFQDCLDKLNSKYNIINESNGEGWYILKNLNAVKNFLKDIEITSRDDCWSEFVELKNGKRKLLRECL
jgi:arabinogalactan endo-1,4-beta-galactosidase